MKCTKCGYDIYEGTTCPRCDQKNSSTANEDTTEGSTSSYTFDYEGQASVESRYSMKWYKFLKVILWFGMISNVISAFNFFRGLNYQGFEDKLYKMLPSLKTLDVFCGIFCIVVTIFGFFVWFSLHNYKAIGPKLLSVMYIANVAFYAIYMFAFSSIINSAGKTIIYGDTYTQGMYQYQTYLDLTVLSSTSVILSIIQIIVGIVMMIANYNYFKKRSDLFVN